MKNHSRNNMSETYIVTAKTVEEAIAIANKTYADAEHEISYDILEMPKKGFLGIGSKDAKIKVTVNQIHDADLASLVSDLRSMKLHTDRDGGEREPREGGRNSNRGEKKPADRSAEKTAEKPATRQNDKSQGERQQNAPKQNNGQKSQNQPKPKTEAPVKTEAPKPEAPKTEAPKADKPQGEPKQSKPQQNQPKQRPQGGEKQGQQQPRQKQEGDRQNAPKQPKPQQNQPKQSKAPAADAPKPEVAKADAALANAVMPKEHTEVIVSAPVGLFDLPEKTEAPVKEEASVKVEEVTVDGVAEVEAETDGGDALDTARENNVKIAVSEEEMTYALEFANTLLRNMQIDARAERGVCPEGETFETTEDATVYPRIEIVGSGTGILIGHHGETLDAIQYLVNLSAIRKSHKANGHGDYVKIVVDVENYRMKREDTLRTLARRMAARAVKTKKNVFLEPMNAYERRIIHSELQTYENVSTHSVGTDKNRKIIITYEGPDKQPQQTRKKSAKPKTEGAQQPKFDRGERTERPRPKKPQKMPIEDLPAFLASSSAEPDEVLSIED